MSRNKFTVCYDVRINSALNETYATIIEKIRFVTEDTRKFKSHDGHRWVYGSYQQLWENLFLNIETPSILRRHLNSLEKMGVLISVRCQYEKLYRINQEAYQRLLQDGSDKLGSRLPLQTVENQQSDCADCQNNEPDCQKEGVRLLEPEQSALYIDKDKKDREIESGPQYSNDLHFSEPIPPEPERSDSAWSAALGQLEIVKGKSAYDNIYRDLKFLSFEDGQLRIQARDAYNQTTAARYADSIAKAYNAVSGIMPQQVMILAPQFAEAAR